MHAHPPKRLRTLVATFALALTALALFAVRPTCAPRVSDAPRRALGPDRSEVSETEPNVAPPTLVSGTRREAEAPQDADDRAPSVGGGDTGATQNAKAASSAPAGASQRFITLQVVQARGLPVPQAKVTVERLWFHPSAAPSVFDALELTADARGRVRFDCHVELGEDLGGALTRQLGLACIATDGAGGASPELVLAPPLEPGPHTLVLGAAAAVTIEVVEGSPPLPVVGAEVHLDRGERDSHRPVRATTDTRGLARITDLSPGVWSYYVQPEGAEHNLRGKLELSPGEDRRLTVTLDEGDEALAVAGRFVDEEGAPIEVGRDDHPKLWVGADLATFGIATAPSADGTFRVYLPRTTEVVVRNFGGHRYEPALTRVPFGTQHLVLRRVERFAVRTLVVEAHDGADGALLTGAQLTVYEADARSASGMSLVKRPSPGRLETTLLARPGTRLVVWADKYAPRFVDLPPSGGTHESPLVVHLERGGWRELFVLDAATSQSITGVELIGKDGQLLTVTDGVGRAEVRSDHVGWLTLRRTGYASERFHPTWPWDRVHLTRE